MTDTARERAGQKTDTLFGADELVINMGPQHPSTHGVLRVKLKVDGERVVGSECVIGYLHRGVEKIAENRTYQQFAPNGLGYCEAVEKLLFVEAPPRARVIRTILTELQRIASHLLWLGTHALDIGALTPLFYCIREREEVLKIFEKYCGARLTTHAFRIGGLQYEAYDTLEKIGYYIVSDGSIQPYRVRIRPPSFINLQALDKMIRGHLVAAVVAIIGTLDIVLGEVDR